MTRVKAVLRRERNGEGPYIKLTKTQRVLAKLRVRLIATKPLDECAIPDFPWRQVGEEYYRNGVRDGLTLAIHCVENRERLEEAYTVVCNDLMRLLSMRQRGPGITHYEWFLHMKEQVELSGKTLALSHALRVWEEEK